MSTEYDRKRAYLFAASQIDETETVDDPELWEEVRKIRLALEKAGQMPPTDPELPF